MLTILQQGSHTQEHKRWAAQTRIEKVLKRGGTKLDGEGRGESGRIGSVCKYDQDILYEIIKLIF